MENNNEWLAVAGERNFVEEMQDTRSSIYCSLKAKTDEEKDVMYNAANNPEFALADAIGQTLAVTDMLIETVKITDDETGVENYAPRIVLITNDGKTYQCVSTGVFNSLRKMVAIYGEPTWTDGLPIAVKQIVKGKKRILSLAINRQK